MSNISKIATCLALTAMFAMSGCKDDDTDFVPASANGGLSELYMEPAYEVKGEQPILIKGYGFVDDDAVTFIDGEGAEWPATTYGIPVGGSGLMVQLHPDMTSGRYVCRVDRADGKSVKLGYTQIVRVVDVAVPDKAGMNVKGIVSCDWKGVPGVVVSDGINLTVTDEKGHYWLSSDKRNGYVFISLPSGYFPASGKAMEGIWRRVSADTDVCDQCDFTLVEEPNDDYTVILMADAHLANRGSGSNNDMNQFRNQYVPDLNATIAEYKAQGKKVYGITLGDLTWDTYWYNTNYKLADALVDFAAIDMPIFHCMGNHDNDIRAITDFETSAPWRATVGPNYYSFNLGKEHYIVLDDIKYTTDGAENKIESPEIVPEEMEWLRKDLATVADKSTPIVVCMHIPLHGHPGREENGDLITRTQMVNAGEFMEAFNGFDKVRLLTGHTHVNFNIPVNEHMIEHNIGGVCATWWWTGKYHDTHICRDGSIGGYGVMEWTGRDYTRYWKSLGHDKSYQFRTYDRNNVWITPAEYAPNGNTSDELFMANFHYLAQDYAWQHTNNEVIINVFSWEDSWEMEVTENGNVLPWTVTNWFDPLHIISFDMFRLNKNNENLQGSALKTAATSHLFRVHPAEANSTLEIKVSDCYGNVYKQTMTRPKVFDFYIE